MESVDCGVNSCGGSGVVGGVVKGVELGVDDVGVGLTVGSGVE